MIHLFGRHTSYNVQKVLWTLDELGVDYQHTNLGGQYGGLDSAEFGMMNPNRRVPVIDDDGVILWESHAIVRYLCAKYGRGTLWAEDPGKRGVADQWMDWAVTSLLPAFIALFWGYYRTPEAQRDPVLLAKQRRHCERWYSMLDDRLAGCPYLAGGSLTMADIPAGASLYRYFEMGLEVEKPPHLMAWYERLMARGPYRQRIAQPFEELFARLDY